MQKKKYPHYSSLSGAMSIDFYLRPVFRLQTDYPGSHHSLLNSQAYNQNHPGFAKKKNMKIYIELNYNTCKTVIFYVRVLCVHHVYYNTEVS